jgi:hypothetical protein
MLDGRGYSNHVPSFLFRRVEIEYPFRVVTQRLRGYESGTTQLLIPLYRRFAHVDNIIALRLLGAAK